MTLEQQPAVARIILRLPAYRPMSDVLGQPGHAELEHRCGASRRANSSGGEIDAPVGRLRRKHHGDQQLKTARQASSVAGRGFAARSRSKSRRRARGTEYPLRGSGVPSSTRLARNRARRSAPLARESRPSRVVRRRTSAACAPAACTCPRAPGGYTLDRAERQAEFAAGAVGSDDAVHVLARADDRIGWAVVEATRAADAGRPRRSKKKKKKKKKKKCAAFPVVRSCDLRRPITRDAAGRAAIDLRFAACERLGVRGGSRRKR